MRRILALDYGERRIGVAISDPLGLTAQSQPFVSNNAESLSKIATLIAEFEVTEIILGWPLNLKGEATAACDKVAEFESRLLEKTSLPIYRIDERLTTKAAERTLLQADFSRDKRKQLIDSQAAAFLLEGYLARK